MLTPASSAGPVAVDRPVSGRPRTCRRRFLFIAKRFGEFFLTLAASPLPASASRRRSLTLLGERASSAQFAASLTECRRSSSSPPFPSTRYIGGSETRRGGRLAAPGASSLFRCQLRALARPSARGVGCDPSFSAGLPASRHAPSHGRLEPGRAGACTPPPPPAGRPTGFPSSEGDPRRRRVSEQMRLVTPRVRWASPPSRSTRKDAAKGLLRYS